MILSSHPADEAEAALLKVEVGVSAEAAEAVLLMMDEPMHQSSELSRGIEATLVWSAVEDSASCEMVLRENGEWEG